MRNVDRILKNFTKMIDQLDRTAVFHEDEGHSHMADASLHQGLAEQHFGEAARATTIRSKLNDLIAI